MRKFCFLKYELFKEIYSVYLFTYFALLEIAVSSGDFNKKLQQASLKLTSHGVALAVVSESIKKLFLIDYFNIYLFSRYFSRFCTLEKCGVTPHCLMS